MESALKALITGADGPLGKCIVRAFEDRGYEVIGTDLPTDLNRTDALASVVHETGHVDVVINNAKVGNANHVHILGRLATKAIVNVASIYGAMGPDPRMYAETEVTAPPSHYVAEKGAMIALTRWQATMFAPVRANAVVLGGIFRGHSIEFENRYSKRVPLGRMATEADAVSAIMFLASDAAAYITGQCLFVDGGLSAW